MLRVEGLTSHYGRIQALKGIDLEIAEGELVALVGGNGAGKTTLLRTLSGVQQASGGRVTFRDREITRASPAARVGQGISQVPEGRQVWAPISVDDNLRLGTVRRRSSDVAADLERMYAMFPVLKEKRGQAAGTLSGGQQQMLALCRALMANPDLLLLDEPSMGLAPLLVDQILEAVVTLKTQGVTVFLVEQNAFAALKIADRGYVIETGKIVLCDSGQALLDNERVKEAYLGI